MEERKIILHVPEVTQKVSDLLDRDSTKPWWGSFAPEVWETLFWEWNVQIQYFLCGSGGFYGGFCVSFFLCTCVWSSIPSSQVCVLCPPASILITQDSESNWSCLKLHFPHRPLLFMSVFSALGCDGCSSDLWTLRLDAFTFFSNVAFILKVNLTVLLFIL